MRRLRLAILGDSPCDRCTAACCRQNGHAYAVLLEGDERRKFAPWARDVPVRQGDVIASERVLPYRDGRCVFLGEDDRCTVYEDRPVNCRRFQCVTGYRPVPDDPAGHSPFLRANPEVVRVLDGLKPQVMREHSSQDMV